MGKWCCDFYSQTWGKNSNFFSWYQREIKSEKTKLARPSYNLILGHHIELFFLRVSWFVWTADMETIIIIPCWRSMKSVSCFFKLCRPGHIDMSKGKRTKLCWILNQGIPKDASECYFLDWKHRYECEDGWPRCMYLLERSSFQKPTRFVHKAMGKYAVKISSFKKCSTWKHIITFTCAWKFTNRLILEPISWHWYHQCCCMYQNFVSLGSEVFHFMHGAQFWWCILFIHGHLSHL